MGFIRFNGGFGVYNVYLSFVKYLNTYIYKNNNLIFLN